MTKKIYIFLLAIVTLLFMSGCSDHVLIDEQNSKLLNYNFRISNPKKIDKILSKQRYAYTTKIDSTYAAVIIIQSKNASIKQYLVEDYESLNLSIPKNCELIISLAENGASGYKWNIIDNIGNGVIKYEYSFMIELPMPRSEKGKCDANYKRQNFYFKPLKSGDEKIVMRLEHKTLIWQPYRDITFNIKVE